jgi:hypothetical protein
MHQIGFPRLHWGGVFLHPTRERTAAPAGTRFAVGAGGRGEKGDAGGAPFGGGLPLYQPFNALIGE